MPTVTSSSNNAANRANTAPPPAAYTVRAGDTMSSIASRHGVSLSALVAANPHVPNPNFIGIGDVLTIPGGSGSPPAGPAPAGNTISYTSAMTAPRRAQYLPFSAEAEALFADAARYAGLPVSWASSASLHNLLERESHGKVGVPNYTYGARSSNPDRWHEVHAELRAGRKTATSSATGLGQLILDNVDAHYPSGRAGIGDPLEEAVGMLRYIQDRYGNPSTAWSSHNGWY